MGRQKMRSWKKQRRSVDDRKGIDARANPRIDQDFCLTVGIFFPSAYLSAPIVDALSLRRPAVLQFIHFSVCVDAFRHRVVVCVGTLEMP
jgi:hypothetical protein